MIKVGQVRLTESSTQSDFRKSIKQYWLTASTLLKAVGCGVASAYDVIRRLTGVIFGGSTMNTRSREELRIELVKLLRKQVGLLEARSLGKATEPEILCYELRQEFVCDLCTQLANSRAA